MSNFKTVYITTSRHAADALVYLTSSRNAADEEVTVVSSLNAADKLLYVRNSEALPPGVVPV